MTRAPLLALVLFIACGHGAAICPQHAQSQQTVDGCQVRR